MTPEQLVAALLDQSAGSVSQLCDTMAACLSRFRQGVREALRSPADDEPLDETAACRVSPPEPPAGHLCRAVSW